MPEEDLTESTESAIETVLDHNREKQKQQGEPERGWQDWASISTMMMALLAGLGGMLAGKTGNDAIIERQREIVGLVDRNELQLQLEILMTRRTIIELTGRPVPDDIRTRIREMDQQLSGVLNQAHADDLGTIVAMHAHEYFATGTTLLSAAITITGMSIVTRRRGLWILGLLISLGGVLCMGSGAMAMQTEPTAEAVDVEVQA
ncbi:MAG: DUF4337 family protein [Planctomycetaceae bacterium]|nr:DUF4337 family protein [Planctomycetaceae bacterium]